MKRLFLLIVGMVCCFSLAANAQLPQFGAKIGLNFANVTGSDADAIFQGNGTRTGLVVGAFMTYDLIPLLSIQPEVLYSQKGTKGSGTEYVDVNGSLYKADYTYTQTFNYIEIPVLLKLNLPLGPEVPVKASVYAGPDFAFNVASNIEATAQAIGVSVTSSMDTKSMTNSFDFNLAFGGGVGYDIGPTTLGLELRYTLGTGTIDQSSQTDFKNGVFAIMVSAGLNL
jgi:hypothetical protein